MKNDSWWVRQAACPHGRAAGLIAFLLNQSNGRHNADTIRALAPSAGDRILEVGFGGGVGLRHVLASSAGMVAGIDISEDMLRRAARVFAKHIQDGRLRLERGTADELPFEDRTFDGVYSVNCIYFWPEPIRGLEEIHRVLETGGRLALGVDPRTKKGRWAFEEPYRGFDGQDAAAALSKSGFVDVEIQDGRRHQFVVTGRRADS